MTDPKRSALDAVLACLDLSLTTLCLDLYHVVGLFLLTLAPSDDVLVVRLPTAVPTYGDYVVAVTEFRSTLGEGRDSVTGSL